MRSLLRAFQWTGDAADRLAFASLLNSNAIFSAPMDDTYKLLDMSPSETISLEKYLQVEEKEGGGREGKREGGREEEEETYQTHTWHNRSIIRGF